MKNFVFLLVALITIDPGKIGRVNTLKSEAKKAYVAGNYKTAIEKYKYLIDSLGINEEEVRMNLANAYFETKDSVNAPTLYQNLANSANPKIRSIANQQLGVSVNRQGKLEEALDYFKQALKADPGNEDARYNYEMVKKKLEEKKKQEQQKQNQDQKKDQKDQQNKDQKDNKEKNDKKDRQDKKDQQNKDQKDKEEQQKKDQQSKEEKEKPEKEKKEKEQQEQKENKDKKEIPPSVSEKLKDMKMSEEKAKMILEAMRNQEIQYLQQNKRKATKPKDKGKPDW